MHIFANAVTNIIFNDAKMALSQNLFHSVTDSTDGGARFHLFNSLPHGRFGDTNHFFDGRTAFITDNHSKSGVGKITFVINV